MDGIWRSTKAGGALLSVFFSLWPGGAAQPSRYAIGDESVIEIHLKSGGLFGFLGDEHHILAPIERGVILHDPASPAGSSVQFEVRADRIRVQDPDLKPQDREEVQAKMESESVLNAQGFPRIRFESSSIRAVSGGEFLVTGDLTLRGVTAPVTVRVQLESTDPVFRATGSARFKQSRFGIKPVTAGAGTVRVKDEMQLTFKVNATPASRN